MARRERDVPRGVPILSEDDVLESRREPVDDRDDLVPVVDGERAARREAVLHVHHEQHVLWARLDLRLGEGAGARSENETACGNLEERSTSVVHGVTSRAVVYRKRARRSGGLPERHVLEQGAERGVRIHAERIYYCAP